MALSSHSSMGRWTCRSMALGMAVRSIVDARPGSPLVLVEPAARLPAEIPGGDHALEQRGGRIQRILELLVQDLGHVQSGVQPDQVEERERAHRMPEPELDRRV